MKNMKALQLIKKKRRQNSSTHHNQRVFKFLHIQHEPSYFDKKQIYEF